VGSTLLKHPACLCGFRCFLHVCSSATFGCVRLRLQHGCSTPFESSVLVWEPPLSPSQLTHQTPMRSCGGWLWLAHSPPFRAGCERRDTLREVSEGWYGFRCLETLDRIRHRLPLSVQEITPSERLGRRRDARLVHGRASRTRNRGPSRGRRRRSSGRRRAPHRRPA